jgi:DNA polymerase-3 subunit alpha
MKFRHFLVPSSFLFVKTVVKPGWTNKDTGIVGEPRIQFTDFKLLHDIMDELCKKITFKLALHEITETKIKDLQHLCVTNGGKQSVHFTIWNAKEKIELNLPSRNTKVKITNELLNTLEKEQISFKLN